LFQKSKSKRTRSLNLVGLEGGKKILPDSVLLLHIMNKWRLSHERHWEEGMDGRAIRRGRPNIEDDEPT
jgi:hypothetical protein